MKPNINIPLHIDKELQEYIAPQTSVEHHELRMSIGTQGLRDAIIAWNDTETGLLTIVDGHNRYQICKESGIDYFVEIKEFTDKDAVREYMLQIQRSRRNSDYHDKEKSLGFSYTLGIGYAQMVGKRGANFEGGKASNTGNKRILIAEQYGVSESKVHRASKVYEALSKVKYANATAFQLCFDAKITITEAVLFQEATIVELMDITTEVELRNLIKELKKRAKEKAKTEKALPTPIVQPEQSESEGLEGTAEGVQETPKEPENLKELRKQLQAIKDKCAHLERTTEKQGKTIEQQKNRLAKYESPKELGNDLYIVHTIYKSYAENMNKLQRAIQEYLAQFEFVTLSDVESFFAQIKVEVQRLNEVHSRCTTFKVSSNFDIDKKYQKIEIGESISLTLVRIAGCIQKATPKTESNVQEYDIAQKEFEITDLLAQNEELRNLKVGDIPPYRLLQLRKIAENYTVFRLEKNKISELVVSGYESDWKVQEFSTGAEALRIFKEYELKKEYFCIK